MLHVTNPVKGQDSVETHAPTRFACTHHSPDCSKRGNSLVVAYTAQLVAAHTSAQQQHQHWHKGMTAMDINACMRLHPALTWSQRTQVPSSCTSAGTKAAPVVGNSRRCKHTCKARLKSEATAGRRLEWGMAAMAVRTDASIVAYEWEVVVVSLQGLNGVLIIGGWARQRWRCARTPRRWSTSGRWWW